MNIFDNVKKFTCVFSNTNVENNGLKNYIVGGNGTFEHIESKVVSSNIKVDNIVDLPKVDEGISFKLPMIPFEIFNTLNEWFKRIYKEYKTESTAFVVYNYVTKEYELFIPKQTNGGASSKYEMGEDPVYINYIKGKELVIVAHSHPWDSKATNPSGIDDADEKDPILYLILGNVSNNKPTYYFSTILNGKRTSVELFDVFENPIVSSLNFADIDSQMRMSNILTKISKADIFEAFMNDLEIPYNEWKKKCTFTSYNSFSSTFSGYSGNLKKYNYGGCTHYGAGYYSNYGFDDYGSREYFDGGFSEKEEPSKKKDKKLDFVDSIETTKSDKKIEVEPSIEEKYEYILKHCEGLDRNGLESGKYSINEVNSMYDDIIGQEQYGEDIDESYFDTLVELILHNNETVNLTDYLMEFIDAFCPELIIDELKELKEAELLEIVRNYEKIGYKTEYELTELSYYEKVLYCRHVIESLTPNEENTFWKYVGADKNGIKLIKSLLKKIEFPVNAPIRDVTLNSLCEDVIDMQIEVTE